MARILEGKPVAAWIKERIVNDVETLKNNGIKVSVAIVRVGERADDIAYENTVIKRCSNLGIESNVYKLPADVSMEKLVETIKGLNEDKGTHGILVFRPLPKHIDGDAISRLIAPEKDIDCMSPLNLEDIFEGKMDGMMPCTPKAVMEILKFYEYDLKGKNVAVVNRSMVVGKPLSMMLLSENATVTICHSRSSELNKITANADIVVTAVGRAKMMTKDYFSPKSVVIDVSINEWENGICGDADYDNVSQFVSAITPVPNGVGSVTTNILLLQAVEACKKQNLEALKG